MLGLNRRTVYIVITRKLLSLRCITEGREVARFEDVPQVALGNGGTVRGGGKAAVEWAQMGGTELFRAFNHPRVAVDGFDNTAKVLRWFLDELNKQLRGLGVVNSVVVHWMEPELMPLTDIEKRTLEQLYSRAVERGFVTGTVNFSVCVCEQREELTAQQVQAFKG